MFSDVFIPINKHKPTTPPAHIHVTVLGFKQLFNEARVVHGSHLEASKPCHHIAQKHTPYHIITLYADHYLSHLPWVGVHHVNFFKKYGHS